MDKKYYIGIDLGGTDIKGGIIDRDGELKISTKVPTQAEKGSAAVMDNIAALIAKLVEDSKLSKDDIAGVGMGVPGMVDSGKGTVRYSNNLKWHDELFIADEVSKRCGFPVKITNDANAAALGESMFGAAKDYTDSVLVTLGTGVGGGIILDNKIFAGNKSAGAEIGHMIIRANGEKCTCGAKGCFEAYSSATALIRDTKRAMLKNKNSLMWEVGLENVNGKTAFDYADKDADAKKVVDKYLEMLAIGLINIANIFRPQLILLGGGISKQKGLIEPLQKMIDKGQYGRDMGPSVPVAIAKLRNDAGLYGAAALWF